MSPLDQAKALTGIVRTAWVGVTAASLYVWLTLASLEDIDLFVSERTFSLPVVGTGIDPRGFFVFAPFLLLAAFFYFHLMLVRLFVCYRALRQEDENSETVPHRIETLVPPWFLTVLIDRSGRSEEERLGIDRAAYLLAVVFSYTFAPLTIFALSYRYLRAHDMFLTFVHCGLTATVFAGAWLFWVKRCDFSADPRSEEEPADGADPVADRAVQVALLAGSFGAVLLFVGAHLLIGFGPRIDHPFGFLSPNAHLHQSELSRKPPGWDALRWVVLQEQIGRMEACESDNSDECKPNQEVTLEKLYAERKLRLKTVIGAQLGRTPPPQETPDDSVAADVPKSCEVLYQIIGEKERDLRHAYLREANLVGANLDCVDMSGAILRLAKLDWATLFGTDLSGADLSWSSLTGASLGQADLRNATLEGARLDEVDFRGARLEGVMLDELMLNGADFNDAKIDAETSFRSAQLNDAIFAHTTMVGTVFENAALEDANLAHVETHTANLQGANLRKANLQGARLIFADMRSANLACADLTGAWLHGALLEGSKNENHLFETILDATQFDGAALRDLDLTKSKVNRGQLGNQISKAFGDGSVVLPKSVKRPDHWCEEVLAPVQFYGLWQKWRSANAMPPIPRHGSLAWIYETSADGTRRYPAIEKANVNGQYCPEKRLRNEAD